MDEGFDVARVQDDADPVVGKSATARRARVGSFTAGAEADAVPHVRGEPHLWLDKAKGRWIILDLGRQVTTSCGRDQRDDAKAALSYYVATRPVAYASGTPLGTVPLARILPPRPLEEAKSDGRSKQKRRDAAETTPEMRERSAAANARSHETSFDWTTLGVTVGDLYKYMELGGASFIERRMKDIAYATVKRPKAPKRTISRSTSITELKAVRARIRRYCVEHELVDDMPVLEIMRQPANVPLTLSRGKVSRLLWATRGRASGASGAFERGSATIAQVKRRRDHWKRFILISIYSGRGTMCVYGLRWRGDPDGKQSYVDVDSGRLYCLGPDAAPGQMKGQPVVLTKRLRAHLTRWRDADEALGFDRVIHALHREDMARPKMLAFRTICKTAGLPDEVMIETLAATTGGWIAKAGTKRLPQIKGKPRALARFKRLEGSIVRSAAFFVGMSRGTFSERYKTFLPEFQKEARKAMDRVAKAVTAAISGEAD